MQVNAQVRKVIAFGYLRIVIQYRGKNYAVVRHVRCSGNFRQNTPAAPPYATKTITSNWPFEIPKAELSRKVRKTRLSNQDEFDELHKRMVALCHQLGFHTFTIKSISDHSGTYFISKKSGILGIPVVFELSVEPGFPKSALADAFGRRGFLFVPVILKDRHNWPLKVYDNVAEMLLAWQEVEPVIDIEDSDFINNSDGLICSLDLNGYGRLLHSSQGNVLVSKDLVQHTIRAEVIRLTSRLLWRLGPPPHQITGDGALFCLSADEYSLEKLCSVYRDEICHPLEIWNRDIMKKQASGTLAGSRLVVIRGGFHFGRIAGADAVMPGLDGQALIDVARLDAGFKNHLGLQPSTDTRHFLVSLETEEHPEDIVGRKSHTFDYPTKENQKFKGKYSAIRFGPDS